MNTLSRSNPPKPPSPLQPIPPILPVRNHIPQLTPALICLETTACWASAGYSTSSCAQVEQALRACMDQPQGAKPRSSEVNYHLSRFQDRVSQPASKENKKKNR